MSSEALEELHSLVGTNSGGRILEQRQAQTKRAGHAIRDLSWNGTRTGEDDALATARP